MEVAELGRRLAVITLAVELFALRAGPAAAQSDVAFPPEVYATRRARLVEQLRAPIVVPSEYMIRHGGEKKQEPNFFYLTGVESPYAILVMAPDGSGEVTEALFLPAHREFAGAQYSFQDPRLIGSAWNRLSSVVSGRPYVSFVRQYTYADCTSDLLEALPSVRLRRVRSVRLRQVRDQERHGRQDADRPEREPAEASQPPPTHKEARDGDREAADVGAHRVRAERESPGLIGRGQPGVRQIREGRLEDALAHLAWQQPTEQSPPLHARRAITHRPSPPRHRSP